MISDLLLVFSSETLHHLMSNCHMQITMSALREWAASQGGDVHKVQFVSSSLLCLGFFVQVLLACIFIGIFFLYPGREAFKQVFKFSNIWTCSLWR